MALKKSMLNKVFIVVLITWFLSLLTIYIPTSKWITPTFPKTINNYTLTIFTTSTVLASVTSLYLGLDQLRAKP